MSRTYPGLAAGLTNNQKQAPRWLEAVEQQRVPNSGEWNPQVMKKAQSQSLRFASPGHLPITVCAVFYHRYEVR